MKNYPSINYNSISKYPSSISKRKISKSKILAIQLSTSNLKLRIIKKLIRMGSKIPKANSTATTTTMSSNLDNKPPSSSAFSPSFLDASAKKYKYAANHHSEHPFPTSNSMEMHTSMTNGQKEEKISFVNSMMQFSKTKSKNY